MERFIDFIETIDFDTILSIAPLDWGNIMACMICGGMIGWERQIQGKPVGIRTSVLICMGTYIFVAIGALVATGTADPTRVVGQVVTGIGFLGAGVMMSKEGSVIGVTSAACIWMLAAMGVLIGTNNALIGIKISVLSIIILVGVDHLEHWIKKLQQGAYARLHPHEKKRDE